MHFQYFIKVTGTRQPAENMYARKQLNFELKAKTPMEAFGLIERYIDENDFITIGCPRKKGVSAIHPYFITGTAKATTEGQLEYNWNHS